MRDFLLQKLKKERENKMLNQFSRTELLIGKEGIEKLKDAKVAVFGIGGVGSFVVEGLARAGIGNFILIDDDNSNKKDNR
jgi:tRNA A37 threonylcarbamoyladenosine dehydratase